MRNLQNVAFIVITYGIIFGTVYWMHNNYEFNGNTTGFSSSIQENLNER